MKKMNSQLMKTREYCNNKLSLDSLFIKLNTISYSQYDNMNIYNFYPFNNCDRS